MILKFWRWLTVPDGGHQRHDRAALSSTQELRIAYYEKSLAAAAGFRQHVYDAWVDAKTVEITVGSTGIEGKVIVIMDDAGKEIMQDLFCFAWHREQVAKDALLKERAAADQGTAGTVVTRAGQLERGN